MAIQQATVFNPDTGDRKVVNVGDPNAFSGGYVLETPTNKIVPKTITRNGSGYNLSKPTYDFTLEDLKNRTALTDMVKDIVQRKQNYNQDIASGKAWVRNVGSDIGAFGSAKDNSLNNPAFFNDADFARLSPSDQASIRQTRNSALNTYNQSLQEEATYRGNRADDTLKTINESFVEARNKSADNRANAQLELDRIKALPDLQKAGYGLDENGKPYKLDVSTTADFENIANAIKAVSSNGDYNAQNGAYGINPADWDKWSAEYAVAQGRGPQTLNPTKEAQDQITGFKIQQFLQKGYSPEEIMAIWKSGEDSVVGGKWKSDPNTSAFVNQTKKALQYLLPTNATGTTLTDANKNSILKTLSGADGSPLFSKSQTNSWSDDMWNSIQSQTENAKLTQVLQAIKEWYTVGLPQQVQSMANPNTPAPTTLRVLTPQQVYDRLLTTYPEISTGLLSAQMRTAGFIYDQMSQEWMLKPVTE